MTESLYALVLVATVITPITNGAARVGTVLVLAIISAVERATERNTDA